MDGNSNSAN